MHSTKFTYQGNIVRLYKTAWQPLVTAKMDETTIEFSIADNQVRPISDHDKVDEELLNFLKIKIAQYFLPFVELPRKRM